MKKQTFHKKYKIRSKLEEEKARKKLQQKEEEKLEVLGQESDKKAKKWIIEEGKNTEKEEKEHDALWHDILHKSRKKKIDYRKMLMTRLYKMVEEIDWPESYEYGVWFDGKGVVLAVKDKFKKLWKRAFKPIHEPKYDLNACFRFAIWAEDILDINEGRLSLPKTDLSTKSKGGIWLPKN